MAKFDPALVELLKHEGLWSNDINDPGGETYRGVSRVYYADWSGWVIVDQIRSHPGFPSNLDDDMDLQALVHSFYFHRWQVGNFSQLSDDLIASHLFDEWTVSGAAILLMQRAVNITTGTQTVIVDGVMGAATICAINATNPVLLLPIFRGTMVGYHQGLAAEDAKLKGFVTGWVKRDLD